MTKSSPALKLDNQLCHRFYTVSNAFTRAYRPLLKSFDITYPQYVVMMALWEADRVTVNQLAEKTHVDIGALSLILKKLQNKSLLVLEPSTEDKRVKFVVLTPSGLAMAHEAEAIPKQMLCNLKNLSLSEAETLRDLIDKLSNGLSESLCNVNNSTPE